MAHSALDAAGKTGPDLDAALFFGLDEIEGTYLLVELEQPDNPKLNEVLRLIARLGGFLGRKGDGEPGWSQNNLASLESGTCRREDFT